MDYTILINRTTSWSMVVLSNVALSICNHGSAPTIISKNSGQNWSAPELHQHAPELKVRPMLTFSFESSSRIYVAANSLSL